MRKPYYQDQFEVASRNKATIGYLTKLNFDLQAKLASAEDRISSLDDKMEIVVDKLMTNASDINNLKARIKSREFQNDEYEERISALGNLIAQNEADTLALDNILKENESKDKKNGISVISDRLD